MTYSEIYQAAIKKWGIAHQLKKLQEELLELATALNRVFNDEGGLDEVIEEIADVQIMLEQARLVIGVPFIDSAIREKMQRLERLINDSTG